MRNISKYAVLALSIFALAFTACGGDDDDDDNGTGGTGGIGDGGTGGNGGSGEGGTGGSGEGGTGGSGEGGAGGEGGTGGDTACADENDESAECAQCVNEGAAVCRETTCAAELETYSVCANENDCVINQQGEVDEACIEENCSTEFNAFLDCLFVDCEEVVACFPAE